VNVELFMNIVERTEKSEKIGSRLYLRAEIVYFLAYLERERRCQRALFQGFSRILETKVHTVHQSC
jgi:hypothetical protein